MFFSKSVRESQQHIVFFSENVKDSHGACVSRNKVKEFQTSLVSFSKNVKESQAPFVHFSENVKKFKGLIMSLSKECESISKVLCVFFQCERISFKGYSGFIKEHERISGNVVFFYEECERNSGSSCVFF